MKIANREFKPRLWPSLATLLLLPVLLSLGFWQLDRAQQRREILQENQKQEALPYLELHQMLEQPDKVQYRKLKVTGYFDGQHTILLDNKVHNKQAGYHVISPLKINNSDVYVLINRGWLPAGASRDVLPKVDAPDGLVSVKGKIKLFDKDVFKLGQQNYSKADWPMVVQWIDLQEIKKIMQIELQPFILLLSEDGPHGYVRKWKMISMSPEKNISYAMQWFALAAALVIIFIVVNSRKLKSETRHD